MNRSSPWRPWWRKRKTGPRSHYRKDRRQLRLELHAKPPRRGRLWREICASARTGKCELEKCQENLTLASGKHLGHIDHIVPEQFIFEHGLGDAHAHVNLIDICREDHGRKTAVEWRLYRGDAIGYIDELRRLGWDVERTKVALRFYGLLDPAREQRCQ